MTRTTRTRRPAAGGLSLTILTLAGVLTGMPALSVAQDQPSATAGGGSSRAQEGSPGSGFSIESEMLTYRALESNSEAVACDIAAYLHDTVPDFKNPPPGAVCRVPSASGTSPGVVLVPFDRTSFDAFQFWRAELEIMRELQSESDAYCTRSEGAASDTQSLGLTTAPKGSAGSASSTAGSAAAAKATAALASIPTLNPYSAALQLSQSLVGMFATFANHTAVGGTIQDQAFMNGVARMLRSLNVDVFEPATYTPFLPSVFETASSPFLTGINGLVSVRSCLETKEAAAKSSDDKLRAQRLIGEIDTYVTTFRGGVSAPAESSSPSRSAAQNQNSQKTETATAAPLSSVAVLMEMLAGEDMARILGLDPATGQFPPAGQRRHLLFVKALESGGSIEGKTNLLGSKDRFSGGSVGTYALFALDGKLECSGNVYEFGGSVPAETFQRDLRAYSTEPQSQYIFRHGGCVASPAVH